jgi:iron complex transport system substrate-binding protein
MSVLINKKFALLFISLMVSVVLLAACGNNNANNAVNTETPATDSKEVEPAPSEQTPVVAEEKTMTDALGNQVVIPANPQRIIGAYLEDHLVTLGVKPAAQWSVPNGIQDYLQTDLNGVPTISYGLPFEEVLSFTPDFLILAYNSEAEGDKYAQYAKIAPTYVLGDEINSDWRKSLLKIGEILNKSDLAQQALDQYEAKAKEAKEKLQEVAAGQTATALWLIQKNFYVVSDKLSSGSVMYTDLGLLAPDVVKEISLKGTGNWNAISLEELAEMNADHIFLINGDKADGAETLKDPIWQNIPAVKNGHIYEMDSAGSWLYTGAIANSQIIDDVVASLVK